MEFFTNYLNQINKDINENSFEFSPKELYEPLNYFLSIGGKRVRPVMVLMACDLFGGNTQDASMPALALEYFHNFTLIHDDIMDEAPLRRNQQTVHIKYNTNTAILSGDALLIKSYQYFENLPAELFKKCIQLFSQTALEVCEGQQYDMNFENKKNVSFEEYIKMISFKTGVLGACAFKIGALIAHADDKQADLIYQFGLNLGIAFQIMDDYLDVFGNLESVGKKHAGDIYENKKTILYLLALQEGNEQDQQELHYWYGIQSENIDKVFSVERIFKRLKVEDLTLDLVKKYTEIAYEYLAKIDAPEENKQMFRDFSTYLLNRTA